jgi:hypothetical protein
LPIDGFVPVPVAFVFDGGGGGNFSVYGFCMAKAFTPIKCLGMFACEMNSLFFFNELLYATAWVSSLHGNLGE